MPLRRTLVVLAVLGLVAASCGGGSGTPASDRLPLPASNATAAQLLPTDAMALPDFDVSKFERLVTQLRGTPALVNVWASWCGPCKTEAPYLATAAKNYGDRVQFLGIDILDSRDSARGFMAEFDWTYPSLFDATGAIRDGLGYIGQPVTLFYDASGDLVSDWIGALTPDVLSKRIEQLLAAAS
jgi:thiol-disulfide isomerase/thioredoxin